MSTCHISKWCHLYMLCIGSMCIILAELLGLERVSLVPKRVRLRWSGHVERKDDGDWVEQCMLMEIEGIRRLRKT